MKRENKKRYIVEVSGPTESKSLVVVASDVEGMYREIYRIYGHLLKDVNGRDIGSISYQETNLNIFKKVN